MTILKRGHVVARGRVECAELSLKPLEYAARKSSSASVSSPRSMSNAARAQTGHGDELVGVEAELLLALAALEITGGTAAERLGLGLS